MKKKSLTEYLTKGFMPYWVGGILLGLMNVLLTAVYMPWGMTGDTATWGLRLSSYFGINPDLLIDYYNEVGLDLLFKHPLFNEETVLNIGVVIGVFMTVTLASEFRLKPIRSSRQVFFAISGGILMGYGARLAVGCNVGSMLGGIASQSVHGWVAGVFIILGSLAGNLLLKYIFNR